MKCTITIEDTGEKTVSINVDFGEEPDETSLAGTLGVEFLDMLASRAKREQGQIMEVETTSRP